MERKCTKGQKGLRNCEKPRENTHKTPKSNKKIVKRRGSVRRLKEKTILNLVGCPSGRITNLSGRAMPHKHTTRPLMSGRVWATPVRTQEETVWTLHTESRNWRKIYREITFPKVSFRTCMYNQLIQQSNSITKI